MTALQRAAATVRGWLGMNDPDENRLHASHGWLLPEAATVRAGRSVGAAAALADSNSWPKL